MKKSRLIILAAVIVIIALATQVKNISVQKRAVSNITDSENLTNEESHKLNELSVEALRKANYPGSTITIEETLEPGSNYTRAIASYQSEDNKIYALLTIPIEDAANPKPKTGWPVIIFNHGYIPPAEYRTTERYIAYTDGFSRNGYVVLRSDYRGHGSSDGQPEGAYGSSAYTTDVLNAVASVKKMNPSTGSGNNIVDPDKIGMWGHSMGGFITLRSMITNTDIKAGVIWAGVVASYPDLLNNWRRSTFTPPPQTPTGTRGWRQGLIAQYGDPATNPTFWNSISANSFLKDVSGPIQLHHGTADTSVPVEFSEKLDKQLKEAGKSSEIYVYQGDDHNLADNFNVAMERSIAFFDKYLK